MRIQFQPAYVIHQRAYRETSLLLDLFTEEYGCLTAIARGIRTAKSKLRPVLQPFNAILVSYQGRNDLMTLISAESNGSATRLTGDDLLSGLYLNELLTRLLHKHDPYPQLYKTYQQTLHKLSNDATREKSLRLFEKKLLEEIGYGVQIHCDAQSSKNIQPENFYRFHPQHGFELCLENYTEKLLPTIFSGKSLLDFAEENLESVTSLHDAKRLMRLVLRPLLGTAPLHSRDLFRRKPCVNEALEK